MILPSRKLFYALEAVVTIAYNAGDGAVSSRDIAEKQGLPARYLEQLMQKLVKAGLLKGVRGPNGGYVLAKERRRISVADICAVLADEKEVEEKYSKTPLGKEIIEPVWGELEKVMIGHLGQVNLAQLCEQAESKKIRKNIDEKMDFII